jgi:hypothetical protein
MREKREKTRHKMVDGEMEGANIAGEMNLWFGISCSARPEYSSYSDEDGRLKIEN